MSINLKCVCCEQPLSEPGALMFGPPRDLALGTSEVMKHHVCVDCWKWVLHVVLERPRRTQQKGLDDG